MHPWFFPPKQPFPQGLLVLIPFVRTPLCPLNSWLIDIHYLCPVERKHRQTKENKAINLTALTAVLIDLEHSRQENAVRQHRFRAKAWFCPEMAAVP